MPKYKTTFSALTVREIVDGGTGELDDLYQEIEDWHSSVEEHFGAHGQAARRQLQEARSQKDVMETDSCLDIPTCSECERKHEPWH